jgi:hypothetical protein
MSKQQVTKQVQATICDFCTNEVDTKGDDYCYAYLPQRSSNIHNPHRVGVKHFQFIWNKRSTVYDYVQYDFHARCFNDLMEKFLAEREPLNPSLPVDNKEAKR